MKFVVVLAALAAVALAVPTTRDVSATFNVQLTGNVTLTNSTQSTTLAYRKLEAYMITVKGSYLTLEYDLNAWFSDAVQVTAVPGQANLDVVADGFFTWEPVLGVSFYPQGFSAWVDASDKYSSSGAVGSGANPTTIGAHVGTLTVAGSFIGNAFEKIDEVDASGNVVKTVDLSQVTFNQASSGPTTDPTGNVHFGWMANTPNGASNGALVNFTIIHSSVLGKLNLGATVSPKATEIVVAISGWTYANAANSLRLTFHTAFYTGSYNGSVANAITGVVATGTGVNQVYVEAQGNAQVNGNTASVTVTVNAQASLSTDIKNKIAYLAAIFSAYTDTIGSATHTVTFPAGASSIVYDPSTGFEKPQGNGAGFTQVSALVVIVASVAAFLFGREL
jgi:hypothetical protein